VGGIREGGGLSASDAMNRYAGGDDTAFAELYERLAPRLFAFINRRVDSAATAEDILQQVFLQVHAARTQFLPGSEAAPWAFAIARRVLVDAFRQSRREPYADVDLDDEPAPASSPAVLTGSRRMLQRLGHELEQVPFGNRRAFELVKFDGVEPGDAAGMLGTTALAVRLRVHRALRELQERMGADVREELAEWA
jgi:RNA polymerase sigma-70 factor, ECF subfamily